jgi:hypothetical protein
MTKGKAKLLLLVRKRVHLVTSILLRESKAHRRRELLSSLLLSRGKYPLLHLSIQLKVREKGRMK